MPGVTKEQIQAAREADLFAYLQFHEPGVLKRDGPNYRHREHDSLVYVTGKRYWYWNSRGRSINALDYLIQIRGYGLVDAVHTLVGGEIQQTPAYRSTTVTAHVQKEPEKKPFSLPWARRCATSAVSYLQRRGISPDVISRCFREGLFYEARYHGEPVCVFVGKDEVGKANNDWKPDTYYVTKGYSILQTNFETREAALKWVQELAKGRSKSGKTRFVPPQLIAVRRTGPDYRNGAEITGQHYLDTFGFRGGEFGNWMNQNDRQASLNMGFEALKDLAAALQVSDKDVAYQGTLAIAFGARGSGNAVAHYEPLRKVINLTKMHGAGSLAHEWWHGFDDYLGTKMGAKGMLSEQPRLYAPFQKLIETMKYKPETPEQAAARTEAQTERTRKNAASWLDSAVLGSLKRHGNEEQMETYAVLREAFLSGEAGSVEQLSAFKKSVTGRVIPKSEREKLEIFEHMLSGMQAQEAPQIGRVETDFYRNSVRMGKECEKDGGYWDSNVEMTARAFACYIKDKLPYQSDYLAGHADCAVTFVSDKDGKMEVLKAYPEGEERRAINAVFDEIVADLKREQILTHSDVTLPLPAQPLAENEQISIFTAERPSVMAQLAAAKPAEKTTPAQAAPKKSRVPEI